MFVRRAARTVRGFLKRGSVSAKWSRPLRRATGLVFEAMEERRLLSASSFDIGEAVVQLADGSIVVGGTSFDFSTNRIKLAKYGADGVLQTSNTVSINGVIWEMAVDAQGRIVAAGTVGSDFAVMRFNPDLTMDTTFGGDGVATAFEPGSAARDLAIQPDGKIVAVGQAADNVMVTYDIGVARFNADGSLDTDFDGDGTATADAVIATGVVGGFEDARGVALDAAGRIVVAANVPLPAGDTGFGLARFTAAGALDGTFGAGNGGLAYVEISPGDQTNDDVVDVGVMPDGTIVVAGTAYYQSASTTGPDLDSVALARFTDTGALDLTFGSGFLDVIAPGSGISIHLLDTEDPFDGLPLKAEAKSLAIAGNRLVVAATVTQTNGAASFEREVGLFGLTLDGYRDTSFGEDGDGHPGVYLHDSGDLGTWDWDDDVRGMAVTATQILVVGMTSNAAPPDFLLVRFGPDGTPGGGGGNVNQPPLAQPGAAYSVAEGASVSLDGSASADPDGTIVSYEWDFDYDGVSFDADATGATPSFSAAGIDGAVSRSLALRVTDDLGASHVQTVQVAVTNAPPVAGIAGDLTAIEGSPVSLTGAFTDACATDTHATLWQVLASNGQVIADGTGTSFGFTPVDDGTYTVMFTVTDDDGGVGSATVDVVVTDAKPVAALTRNDGDPVVRQWDVRLTGSLTDASNGVDTHTLAWSVVDAGGVAVASGAGSNVRFTPVSDGAHVVTFTVTDDDGSDDSASVTIGVLAAAVVDNVLRVGGTSLGDDIVVEPTASDTVRVRFEGVSAGTFAPTKGVVVRAGGRADAVTVATGLSRPTTVFGGSGLDTLRSANAGDMLFGEGGNDKLLGNSGHDVIVGGDGDDLLVGGKGDDLLIGGLGADSLVGNANDDVIVGGWTAHDSDPGTLVDLLRTWRQRADYQSGVAALRVSGALLENDTVFDDGARDVMTGEGGRDVFYGNFDKPGVLDHITDLKASEFEADLDLIMPLEP